MGIAATPVAAIPAISEKASSFIEKSTSTSARGKLRLDRYIRLIVGIIIGILLLWRVYNVIVVQQNFGADTWVRFGISGLILVLGKRRSDAGFFISGGSDGHRLD